MNRHKTDDERLVIACYQQAKEKAGSGDDEVLCEINLDILSVGQSIGMSAKKVAAIRQQLQQANFLKPGDEKGQVLITSRGIQLAQSGDGT